MPTLLLRTYYGSNLLQYDTGSFFSEDSHNSSFKLKAHSQLSKKFVDKFCSSSFGAIVGSRKNVSNMLCLIMKILTEKKP